MAGHPPELQVLGALLVPPPEANPPAPGENDDENHEELENEPPGAPNGNENALQFSNQSERVCLLCTHTHKLCSWNSTCESPVVPLFVSHRKKRKKYWILRFCIFDTKCPESTKISFLCTFLNDRGPKSLFFRIIFHFDLSRGAT